MIAVTDTPTAPKPPIIVSPYEAQPPDRGNWLSYDVESPDQGLIWPAVPYNQLRICNAPESEQADIAIEIAASDEPFFALEMEQVEIIISNSGNGVWQNQPLKIELGTRHPAELELDNSAALVAAIVPAPDSDCTIDGSGRVITCQLPNLEPGDIHTLFLNLQAPHIGSKLEIATETDGAKDENEFSAVAPVIVAEEIPQGPTEIFKIFPVSPQIGRDEFGQFATRYPFGDDPLIDGSDQSRILLVLVKTWLIPAPK